MGSDRVFEMVNMKIVDGNNIWYTNNDEYVLISNGKQSRVSPRYRPTNPDSSPLMKRTVANADKFFMGMRYSSPSHEKDALMYIGENLVKHNKALTAEYVKARNQPLRYGNRYTPARDYPAYAKAVFSSPDFAVLMAKDLGFSKNPRSTGIAPMKASVLDAIARHFIKRNGGLPSVIKQIESEERGAWIHPETAAIKAIRSNKPTTVEIVSLLAHHQLLDPSTLSTLDMTGRNTRTILMDIYTALAILAYVRIFDKHIKRRLRSWQKLSTNAVSGVILPLSKPIP